MYLNNFCEYFRGSRYFETHPSEKQGNVIFANFPKRILEISPKKCLAEMNILLTSENTQFPLQKYFLFLDFSYVDLNELINVMKHV